MHEAIARQGVPAPQSHHHRLPQDRLDDQAVAVGWRGWAQQAEVEPALAQGGQLPASVQFVHVELDVREPLVKGAQDRRKHAVGRRADEAEREPPDFPLLGTASCAHCPVQLRQRAPRLSQQHLTGGGELDAALGAAEQRDPHLRLELADVQAEGRLRNPKPFRGAGEVELIGDGDEPAELALLHGFHTFPNMSRPEE